MIGRSRRSPRDLAAVVRAAAAAALLLVGASCGRSDAKGDTAPLPAVAEVVDAATGEGPVHTITLLHDEPEPPALAGRDDYLSACVICHSPRYVSSQPRFAREVWQAEVHKMIATFGAPVPPGREGAVVDYLVAWRGNQAPP